MLLPPTLRSLASAAVLALVLAGCQTAGQGSLIMSDAPADVSGPAASAIAGELVSRLAEQVGPGTATIALQQDGSPFGEALETALKGWGYSVVTDQKTDGGSSIVPLAYMIIPFEGQVLARLSTADVELGRAYSVTAAGATPASPVSVMRRG
ncbi:MAG: conjugal transfer protein TrbH [Xanthobacteraceae bacterium]